MTKVASCKAIASINLNGEKLKAVPLKSGTGQGCLLYPYLFTHIINNKILLKNYRKRAPAPREENKNLK